MKVSQIPDSCKIMARISIESLIESRIIGQAECVFFDSIQSTLEISHMICKGMDGEILKRLCQVIPRKLLADTLVLDYPITQGTIYVDSQRHRRLKFTT